jgi:hypothetical protein
MLETKSKPVMARKITLPGQKGQDEDDDGIANLSNEDAPLTATFHVHQSILASVSTYFQSQFCKQL